MKVNNVVYYVPSDSRHGSGKLVDVVKVGRKYFYVRVSFNELKCIEDSHNGYCLGSVDEWPYGTIYKTEQDYLEFLEWKDFEINIPSKLTREQKFKILKVVKGEL